MRRRASLAFALAATCLAQSAAVRRPAPVIEIAPGSLKGDLSFLASDAMQGRYTPSHELDIAAEFIASRFRAIGLEPAGPEGYFQNASMVDRAEPAPEAPLLIQGDAQSFSVPPASYTLLDSGRQASFTSTPALVFDQPDLKRLAESPTQGKWIIVAKTGDKSTLSAFRKAVRTSGAAGLLLVTADPIEHSGRRLLASDELSPDQAPVLLASSTALLERTQASRGSPALRVTAEIPAPDDRPVLLHNVAGILPGTDPSLKQQIVVVSAHYDHIGTAETAGDTAVTKPTADDRIYNGANDDGSGTVSVIAIAQALARRRPRRTILFLTFFGEERGLIGSTYYARHPLFPIARTVADINLEQLGRPDEMDSGPPAVRLNAIKLTGFTFSDLWRSFDRAGKAFGVTVTNDEKRSDPYFSRSDNISLSRVGVPSTTICSGFEFPDYHGVGDEWQKIDFSNLARIDRALGLAILNVANAPARPSWNSANPGAAPFRNAREALEELAHNRLAQRGQVR